MFITAHIACGLIIGKLTGSMPMAVFSALFLDIDHLIPYIKHGVIKDLKKFWKTVTDPKDPYGNQRNYLHSIPGMMILSAVMLLINQQLGIVFFLGYLSHLILDALDGSDFYPFYPLKWKIHGPIKYLSVAELIFTIILFAVAFVVW